MYEARKFLLGLETNGVSSSSPSVALNPATNGPSPSLICPVGLEILASAGLGLSNLGNDTNYLKTFPFFLWWDNYKLVKEAKMQLFFPCTKCIRDVFVEEIMSSFASEPATHILSGHQNN